MHKMHKTDTGTADEGVCGRVGACGLAIRWR